MGGGGGLNTRSMLRFQHFRLSKCTCFSSQTHTAEVRKRKEMEHEMLSNPVKGFNGNVSYTVNSNSL